MGLRASGVLLIVAGLVGAILTWRGGPNASPVFFAIESGIALAVGMGLLAAGGLRHGYHTAPLGAPPGDMDLSQAVDPNPPA
jgi:hypothetical protein